MQQQVVQTMKRPPQQTQQADVTEQVDPQYKYQIQKLLPNNDKLSAFFAGIDTFDIKSFLKNEIKSFQQQDIIKIIRSIAFPTGQFRPQNKIDLLSDIISSKEGKDAIKQHAIKQLTKDEKEKLKAFCEDMFGVMMPQKFYDRVKLIQAEL
ncbi:Hypothetical_protein [Hexamita inflata]|uniref:Hypothetical_protein n=1 Tax=Hexamita inflata TaxID=28002 RepID=A0AA86UHG5_9EUKA|nr:Hypothetical protein HINF_LOCUS39706 [Hexamita inflata]